MVQIGAGSQLRLRAIVTRGEIDLSVLEKRACNFNRKCSPLGKWNCRNRFRAL